MDRHYRRLTDTEDVQAKQQTHGRACQVAFKNAAGCKSQRTGNRVGPDNGRQQQTNRGAQQDAQVDARRAYGSGIALVGNQRVRRKRENFVTQEQGEQVIGEGHTECGGNGDGEAHVEPRLVLFVVAAHVTDGVHGIHDPQRGCQCREQHPQRFYREGDRQATEDLSNHHARTTAVHNARRQRPHGQCQYRRRDQRDGFAKVRPAPGQGDTHCTQQRPQQRKQNGVLRTHCRPPSNSVADISASESGKAGTRPK